MKDVWVREARRRRVSGLVFLGGAAVAVAVAALLFFTGFGPFAATPAVLSIPLIATAVAEFIGAHRDERRAVRRPNLGETE